MAVFLGVLLLNVKNSGERQSKFRTTSVSKIKVGMIYSTDKNRSLPSYNQVDGGFVKLVDDHRWVSINQRLGDSSEKDGALPTLSIMEGMYRRVGSNIFFNSEYKIIGFEFSNSDNARKYIYYMTSRVKSHIFRSKNHVNLIKESGIYFYGDSPIYPARGKMPDSISKFVKSAQYRPETKPN